MTTPTDVMPEQVRLLTRAVLTLARAQRVDGQLTPDGARAAEYAFRVAELGGWDDALNADPPHRE